MENTEPKQEKKSPVLEAAERLEKANAEAKELLAKQEEMLAAKVLSGEVDAGIQPPEKKPISNKEYAEALSKGIVLKD